MFVRTKRGADRLVKRLGAQGLPAVAMHGNKSQRQRERALASFESGAIDTLVATDVAARGIDVSGISHVINFDPPADSETYVHRIGRTGRAGATGVGITLVAPSERGDVRQLAGQLGLEHGLGGTTPERRPSRPAPARRADHRPHRGNKRQRPSGRAKSRSRDRATGGCTGTVHAVSEDPSPAGLPMSTTFELPRHEGPGQPRRLLRAGRPKHGLGRRRRGRASRRCGVVRCRNTRSCSRTAAATLLTG